MGWNSSVGIMQQLSRELLLTKGMPAELEHKGRPAAAWFVRSVADATPSRSFWQVYLDNFTVAEHVQDEHYRHDIRLQEVAMKAWCPAGVLAAEDKQVLGAETANSGCGWMALYACFRTLKPSTAQLIQPR